MLDDIQVLCHSSIKMEKDIIIYFDPFKIEKEYKDADFIFITHSHYDHFSEKDILKIKKENTKIIITPDLHSKTLELGFNEENILVILPNQEYKINELYFKTIPAYNINKNFHPKANNWVGYIIILDDVSYYIAGDTDITEENRKVKCDVAFVPIGGTYTMTAKEAAILVNEIKPKIAVPIHYGLIVGSKEDEKIFKENLDDNINVRILL